jgi:hypothetical protein
MGGKANNTNLTKKDYYFKEHIDKIYQYHKQWRAFKNACFCPSNYNSKFVFLLLLWRKNMTVIVISLLVCTMLISTSKEINYLEVLFA